ncbi:hypothetical protein QGN23_10225 [Chryseobacterium gotjawalense]|uniref:Toxin-antitoxin system protein n=1 Tax=Chryseobacterium gotjawalense TaxID=3042315 RepID=A0ABY8RA27_9FLAO|nr:hypothetical protein [Chryseobacterium sp. wdc7]WHF50807.1 hypothetical protein QGN23_10225 [Chryseobacterium sp. wdc7]
MIKEKKLTSIRLSKNLYAHLQKKAKEENRSVNNYIETLLFESSEYFEPNEDTVAAIEEVQEMIKNKSKDFEVISDVRQFLEELRDEEL